MTTLYDVPSDKLVEELSKELEKIEELTPPEWAKFVKTGAHKERPPEQENWWHIRLAAIMCSLYKKSPIGTERLRTKFGGKRNMGAKPSKFVKGSGAIIRRALQQLEKAKFVEKSKGAKKGRVLTGAGRKIIDEVSYRITPK